MSSEMRKLINIIEGTEEVPDAFAIQFDRSCQPVAEELKLFYTYFQKATDIARKVKFPKSLEDMNLEYVDCDIWYGDDDSDSAVVFGPLGPSPDGYLFKLSGSWYTTDEFETDVQKQSMIKFSLKALANTLNKLGYIKQDQDSNHENTINHQTVTYTYLLPTEVLQSRHYQN